MFIIPAAVAQTESRAYAADDGKAHVIYVNGVANTVPPRSRSAAKAFQLPETNLRLAGHAR